MNFCFRTGQRIAKMFSLAVCELGDRAQLLETAEHASQADSDSRAKIVVYGELLMVAMMSIHVAVAESGTGMS